MAECILDFGFDLDHVSRTFQRQAAPAPPCAGPFLSFYHVEPMLIGACNPPVCPIFAGLIGHGCVTDGAPGGQVQTNPPDVRRDGLAGGQAAPGTIANSACFLDHLGGGGRV